MKKIIGIAAVAAMVATSAFAEITFGAWGRGIWYTAANYYNGSDNEVVTGMDQSWGGAAPRVGLSIHGSSENAGFDLDYYGNGDTTGVGDNVRLWVKPIQQFKLMMGKIDDHPLRGDAAFGLWNWRRIGAVNSMGEGFTFPNQNTTGAQLAFYPIEGLSIYAVLPLATSASSNTAITTELGHKSAYYAAYAIKDIGTVKAGVTCKDKAANKDGTDTVNYAVINAAFDLTAVKNLFVTIGAFIPTSNDIKADTTTVNAYAKYTMDKLTIHVIAGTMLNTYDDKSTDIKKDGAFGLAIGGGVDYALDNGFGLFADARYGNAIWMAHNSSDHNDALTLGAGITKGFSNGSLGVAFEGVTNGGNYGIYKSQKNTEDFSWAIPVKAEYWF